MDFKTNHKLSNFCPPQKFTKPHSLGLDAHFGLLSTLPSVCNCPLTTQILLVPPPYSYEVTEAK